MSNGTTTAGTCMSVTADTIPTHDQAGFEDVGVTWSQSSEVTNIGDVGPENEVITFQTVCDGLVHKRMGSQNYGQQTLEAMFDLDNTAQGILDTAAKGKSLIAVKMALATNDIVYYKAYVANLKIQPGSASDMLRISVTLEIEGTTVEVNAA